MSHLFRLSLFLAAAGCEGSTNTVGFAGHLLSVASTSAEVGKQGRLRVEFDNPLAGDTNVMLTSSTPSVATIGDHVTVPRGAISAEMGWTGVALGSTTFYATAGSITQLDTADVVDHFTVSSIGTDDSALEKGATTTVYVYLNAAPPDPTQVETSAADPSVVSLPATATISPWSSYAPVAINALTVGSTTVNAKLGSDQVSTPITVVDHARLLGASSLGSQAVEVGGVITGNVTVDAAVAMPTTVMATTTVANVAAAPTNIVIPSGGRSASVRIPVMGAGQTTLGFSLADSSFDISVTGVASLHLTTMDIPTPLQVGSGNTGRVTVDAIAGAPHQIALTSSDPTIVSVPAEVTLAPGTGSVSFPVSPLKSGTATITASFGGSSLPTVVYVSEPAGATIQLSWYEPRRLLPGANGQLQIYSTSPSLQLTSSDPTVIAVPATLNVPSYYAYTRLTALKAGKTTISASAGGLSSTLDLEVVATPDLQLGPTFTVTPGMTTVGEVFFQALAPTGTYVTFSSSNTAVLATPPPVTLGNPDERASFQLVGVASGTAILTATTLGVSRSAVVYVGASTPEPVFLVSAAASSGVLEKGAATLALLDFSSTSPVEVPITLTVSPVPMPAIATIADPKPALAPGESRATVPLVGVSAGTVLVTATAGGVTRSFNLVVLDQPTFSMSLGPTVDAAAAIEGTIQSDCLLAVEHQVSLNSSDTGIATVTPSVVTLSPGTTSVQFEVKGVSPGSTLINYVPSPLPTPSPVPTTVTVQ